MPGSRYPPGLYSTPPEALRASEGALRAVIEGCDGEQIAMRKKHLYRPIAETFVAISL